jgi:tRNA(fMet)-specific endonuclease VapC
MSEARYLLDTSVYSQPLKARPLWKVLERWQSEGDKACAVCGVVVAEVEYGLHRSGSVKRWRMYRDELLGRLKIVPMDSGVWRRFAETRARQQSAGQTMDDFDLLIAATALEHGLIVATLNVRHFSMIAGLIWEDWSE